MPDILSRAAQLATLEAAITFLQQQAQQPQGVAAWGPGASDDTDDAPAQGGTPTLYNWM